jgi:hypothetical protein
VVIFAVEGVEDRVAEVLAMLDRFWGERLSALSDEVARARGATTR